MLFNNENQLEIERLKAEVENYQSQLKVKSVEIDQLQEKYNQKDNDLQELLTQIYMSFKKLAEIAERNDYGNLEQKVRQLHEFILDQKKYYAQYETSDIKNRTTTTYHSNK